MFYHILLFVFLGSLAFASDDCAELQELCTPFLDEGKTWSEDNPNILCPFLEQYVLCMDAISVECEITDPDYTKTVDYIESDCQDSDESSCVDDEYIEQCLSTYTTALEGVDAESTDAVCAVQQDLADCLSTTECPLTEEDRDFIELIDYACGSEVDCVTDENGEYALCLETYNAAIEETEDVQVICDATAAYLTCLQEITDCTLVDDQFEGLEEANIFVNEFCGETDGGDDLDDPCAEWFGECLSTYEDALNSIDEDSIGLGMFCDSHAEFLTCIENGERNESGNDCVLDDDDQSVVDEAQTYVDDFCESTGEDNTEYCDDFFSSFTDCSLEMGLGSFFEEQDECGALESFVTCADDITDCKLTEEQEVIVDEARAELLSGCGIDIDSDGAKNDDGVASLVAFTVYIVLILFL